MANEPNRRSLADALTTVTKALPAQNANNTTDGIYIGGQGPHRERLKLRVTIPANSVLVAAQTLTLALQDSADNSSFAAVAGPGQSHVITGDTGFAADTIYFDIPAHARDYVAVNQAVSASGGNNTGTTFTYEIVS